MADYSDLVMATRAVADPSTSPADLAAIAQMQPGLRAQVAAHPNVYPALLQWLGATRLPPASAAPVSYVPSRQMAPVAGWQLLVAGILVIVLMGLCISPMPLLLSFRFVSKVPRYAAIIITLTGGVLLCLAIRNRRQDRIALNLVVVGFGISQVLAVLGFRLSTGEYTDISLRLSETFELVADSFGLLVVLVIAVLVNLSMMAQVRRALAVAVMVLLGFQIVFVVLGIHNGNVWDAIVRRNGWGTNPAMTPGGWMLALLPLVIQVAMFTVLVLPLVTKPQASRGVTSVGSASRAAVGPRLAR